jgi:hypothetical protein
VGLVVTHVRSPCASHFFFLKKKKLIKGKFEIYKIFLGKKVISTILQFDLIPSPNGGVTLQNI